MNAFFEAVSVNVSYGPITAVSNVSLRVDAQEFLCIAGPNGAGKSSLVGAIVGITPACRTSIMIDGQSTKVCAPSQAAALGIGLVLEGRHIFTRMTVKENIAVVARRVSAQPVFGLDEAFALFPVLHAKRNLKAGLLSGGEQQQLAIARALATGPRLLLIDEPSLGLAPLVVTQLYEALADLRRTMGITLIVVEQAIDRIAAFADRVLVMRQGQIVLEAKPKDLSQAELHDAYLSSFVQDVAS